MLTPMDIHNKEFKRGFRGYSEEDVDAFMNNIAGDYEKVYREYCELKERCDSLQDKLTQYEKMEATMNSTLMLAQQTAENVKVSARKEADLILQEAESKKKQMLDETMMNLQKSQQEWKSSKPRPGIPCQMPRYPDQPAQAARRYGPRRRSGGTCRFG